MVPWVPDQAPEALQLLALVDDQLNVVPLPLVTVLGLATKLTVGAGSGAEPLFFVTVIVTDLLVVPPEPVHDSW